ncbi:condensation domain-containing protein [Nocardiopsis sp. B62]|uniref:condensation domain-containing protein n=1 Tax=Nocardiopsis sp. B62 TaxID=2824874 RepID=UPI001B39B598|nr:condensation domain-containing protein [Nocardiopsis sp. B62]MBQ1080601.1 peptide synthase [Nocardiopsis sp. B62]
MTVSEAPTEPRNDQDRIPLSCNQQFVSVFDGGDEQGPFGPRYHIVHGWRLRGPLDVPALRLALDDMVERHEALRTVIIRDRDEYHQRVLAVRPVSLTERPLHAGTDEERAEVAEALVSEVESWSKRADEVPHLRAVLGRFDEEDAVLVLMAHHIATDGWSVRVLVRDLAEAYAVRRDGGVPGPDGVPQYSEHVWEERARAESDADRGTYWRHRLDGARLTATPTDHPRSEGRPPRTAVYRFGVAADRFLPVLDLARRSRSTPFMVLLTAYGLHLSRLTGETDLVVPTFTPGRPDQRFHRTVGPFFNFLPLRVQLGEPADFREVLGLVRRACGDDYSQDIPAVRVFAEAPELMAPGMADDAAPVVFQVFPAPQLLANEVFGGVEFAEIQDRLTSVPQGADVPDGALWTIHLPPTGELFGSVQYRTDLFEEATVIEAVESFLRTLLDGANAPETAL